jgi:predicted TIM-barrel fold metal-dependent hydrolase
MGDATTVKSAPEGAQSDASTFPWVISVDDHILEPPDLWTSRLPGRLRDRGPRVVRQRSTVSMGEGELRIDPTDSDDGVWADWWVYDDSMRTPLMKIMAAVGFDKPDATPTTYDDVAPGCWVQSARLADMHADHVEASLGFPNVVARFSGQTFQEGTDKALGLASVQAYNDWILDDWTSGAGRGHLLPMTLIPLWDVQAAVTELERCVMKGTLAVAFTENPHYLGLPSLYSGYWDPFFEACAHHEVMCAMHIGSSSHSVRSSPDAPHITSTLAQYTASSLMDFIFSGILDRVPRLKIFYAESQAGWMPFLLEQADILWEQREGMSVGSEIPRPPSSYLQDRVYTSVFNDAFALKSRDAVGFSQMCYEVDYPHGVSTFPNTLAIATKLCADAGMSEQQTYQLMRGNAIRGFNLERVGITH